MTYVSAALTVMAIFVLGCGPVTQSKPAVRQTGNEHMPPNEIPTWSNDNWKSFSDAIFSGQPELVRGICTEEGYKILMWLAIRGDQDANVSKELKTLIPKDEEWEFIVTRRHVTVRAKGYNPRIGGTLYFFHATEDGWKYGGGSWE